MSLEKKNNNEEKEDLNIEYNDFVKIIIILLLLSASFFIGYYHGKKVESEKKFNWDLANATIQKYLQHPENLPRWGMIGQMNLEQIAVEYQHYDWMAEIEARHVLQGICDSSMVKE